MLVIGGESMTIKTSKTLMIITMVGLTGLLFYLVGSGAIFDQEKIEQLILSYGAFAPVVFIGLQIIQVVIPIIPGGVSSAIGVVLFGAEKGFVLNFIGLMIGVTIAFLLTRKYGKEFILKFVEQKTYDKYIHWIDKGKKFDVFFFIALLLPGLPDDLLCMIAGLTKMKLSKYLVYNAISKTVMLAVYSIGITELLDMVGRII